jgi:hypothetical protein
VREETYDIITAKKERKKEIKKRKKRRKKEKRKLELCRSEAGLTMLSRRQSKRSQHCATKKYISLFRYISPFLLPSPFSPCPLFPFPHSFPLFLHTASPLSLGDSPPCAVVWKSVAEVLK